MAGGKHQVVVQDDQYPPRFLLLGERVDAPSHNPVAVLRGNAEQLTETGERRPRTDVLAYQSGYVPVYQQLAFGFVQKDKRAPVFYAVPGPVELDGGFQPILVVVPYGFLYVGLGQVILAQCHGLRRRLRSRAWNRCGGRLGRRGGRWTGGRGGGGFPCRLLCRRGSILRGRNGGGFRGRFRRRFLDRGGDGFRRGGSGRRGGGSIVATSYCQGREGSNDQQQEQGTHPGQYSPALCFRPIGLQFASVIGSQNSYPPSDDTIYHTVTGLHFAKAAHRSVHSTQTPRSQRIGQALPPPVPGCGPVSGVSPKVGFDLCSILLGSARVRATLAPAFAWGTCRKRGTGDNRRTHGNG